MDYSKYKNIYIRVDAGDTIGMGHFTRSLALADMLKNKFKVTIFTRYLTDFILNEIEKLDLFYVKLSEADTIHFDEFLNYLKKDDIVVLDNYFFSTEYQSQIKRVGCKLICIDDMHDKHYLSDIVINHGLGLDKNLFSIEKYTKLCLGLDYALLRKPFLNIDSRKRTKIKSCLICLGGVDYHDITSKILEIVESIDRLKYVNIIVGSGYKNFNKLALKTKMSKKNIKLHCSISSGDVASLMKDSDFGILSASSICLEAISIGLPFMVGYYVENQKELYSNLTEKYGIYGLNDLLKIRSIDLDNFDFKNAYHHKVNSKALVDLFCEI